MSILDFPNEITLQIFSYVESATRDDAAENASKAARQSLWSLLGVCRAWRGLAADPSLWRHRVLPPTEALWMVQHHPAAQFGLELALASELDTRVDSYHFGLSDQAGKSATFLQHMQFMRNAPLREGLRQAVVGLVLLRASREAVDLTGVKKLFSDSPRIVRVVDRGWCGLTKLTWLPQLESATISSVNVSPGFIAEAFPRLRKLAAEEIDDLTVSGEAPALEELTIQRVRWSRGAAASFVGGCPNLHALNWRIESPEDIPHFVAPQLTSLEANSDWLWHASFLHTPGAIDRFPRVTRLAIKADKPFSVRGASERVRERLKSMLAVMPSLNELRMTVTNAYNARADYGLPALWGREARKEHPHLRYIEMELADVKRNVIDSDPAVALAQVTGVFLECDLDWTAFWRAGLAAAPRQPQGMVLQQSDKSPSVTCTNRSVKVTLPRAVVGETESGVVRASAVVVLSEVAEGQVMVLYGTIVISLTLQ